MGIQQFFDDVMAGVSAFEDFFARMLMPLESVLGAGDPLAKGLAQGLALLQKDVGEVKLMIAGQESPFVMTQHVYNSVVGFIQGLAGQYKGQSLASVISQVLVDAEKGIPVALSVLGDPAVPGSTGTALVKIGEDALTILVPLVIAAL